jgi:single-stranded DNA-binding protein
MIEALISGKLYGMAEQRTSRSGNSFATAKVRCPSGDEAIFVSVIAFSESVQAALLALDDGEAVSLAGTLTAKAWNDREGNARAGADLIANAVLTVHHAKRKREAMRSTAAEGTQTGQDTE